MNRLKTTLLMVLITVCTASAHSQSKKVGKPFLFTNFPSVIECSESQLSTLFAASKGQDTRLYLAENFTVSGPVISNIEKYSNLHTIVIQMPGFNNTLFSLSKQTDQFNNHLYVGRMLNPLFADGYELLRNPAGNYQFVKTDLEKIVVKCNL